MKVSGKPETNGTAIVPRNDKQTIKTFLESASVKARLAQVASRYVNPDKLVRLALVAIHRTPRLLECSQESLLLALMESAQTGLEPNTPSKHAYLIPRKNKKTGRLEAQFQTGYRGVIELMRRGGDVASAEARVVYARDFFEFEYGLNMKLVHRPFIDGDAGAVRLAYAIIHLKDHDALPIVDVMPKAKIDAVMESAPGHNDGPWATHYDEMARKTVLFRAAKYAPIGEHEAEAIEREANKELGTVEFPAIEPPADVPELPAPPAETKPAEPTP